MADAQDEDRTGEDFDQKASDLLDRMMGPRNFDPIGTVFNLLRAAHRIEQDLETGLHRPTRVSTAGFNALFALYVLGAKEPKRLARLANVSQPSMSSLIKTLESRELVFKRPSRQDRRSVLIELTTEGRALCDELIPATHARAAQWSSALDAGDRDDLARILRKLLSVKPPSKRASPTTED